MLRENNHSFLLAQFGIPESDLFLNTNLQNHELLMGVKNEEYNLKSKLFFKKGIPNQ